MHNTHSRTHPYIHLIQLGRLIPLQFKINQIRSEIVIVPKIRIENCNGNENGIQRSSINAK